jgi:hypothetical protein
MRGAFRRASSNGQRQQFNNAQSDYQHGERHVIVIECLLDKRHGEKAPLKRQRFSSPVSRGFLYTPEASP